MSRKSLDSTIVDSARSDFKSADSAENTLELIWLTYIRRSRSSRRRHEIL